MKFSRSLLCVALTLSLTLGFTGTSLAKPALGEVRVLTDTQVKFSEAVENDDAATLETLLKNGLSPNQMVREGDPALVRAIRLGNDKALQILLKAENLDVNMSSTYGENALMLAAFAGNMDLTKLLLEKGAFVSKTSGWTALHYAATNGHDEIVKLLIEKGANVNVRTDFGVTPLYMASRGKHRQVVMTLLRAGAYRDLCNLNGQSPADAARMAEDKELADYLAVDRCIEPEDSPFKAKIQSAKRESGKSSTKN